MEKVALGNNTFARYGSGAIILTSEEGCVTKHCIHIEPQMVAQLEEIIKKVSTKSIWTRKCDLETIS